jgi:hypothetical protein
MNFNKYYLKEGANWNHWLDEDTRQKIADKIGVSLKSLNEATASEENLDKAVELTEGWLEGKTIEQQGGEL